MLYNYPRPPSEAVPAINYVFGDFETHTCGTNPNPNPNSNPCEGGSSLMRVWIRIRKMGKLGKWTGLLGGGGRVAVPGSCDWVHAATSSGEPFVKLPWETFGAFLLQPTVRPRCGTVRCAVWCGAVWRGRGCVFGRTQPLCSAYNSPVGIVAENMFVRTNEYYYIMTIYNTYINYFMSIL